MHDLETSFAVWRLWRATDRRFLPSQLLNEPTWLLDDLLTLDAAYQIEDDEMKRQHPKG